ncbi:DUF932 domain-containing protein [Haloglycomyces albus]|uniref:DUF932 domain-containing protein n=1 Tax=Haloglycomyces albus TaxID=526067 RepID=UPI00055176EA|nr:DUF932 domain-containing protein [Haloglycomyces albus]
MAHLFESGFFVRQPAWHGLGTVLDEHPDTWEEARRLAGLEWEVVDRPLPLLEWNDAAQPRPVVDGNGTMALDPDWKAIARSDNGRRLAIVRDSYEIISMRDFGVIFQEVLDQTNVTFETAGSLDEGRMVWALAYLDEPYQVGGDDSLTAPYMLLISRHDGSSAARLIPTSVRVVCANTVKAAEMEGRTTGAAYSFRHTKNWRNRIGEAKEAVGLARSSFRAHRAIAEELYGLNVDAARTEWFIEQLMPYPSDTMMSDRVRANVDASRNQLRLLAYEVTNENIAHTAYGLFQMAVEYLDHVRPHRSATSYFTRSMVDTNTQKNRAARLAHEAALVSL